MSCTNIAIKDRKLCIGNLSERITIQTRSIANNNTGTIELSESFTSLVDVWAAVETTRGSQLWDGVSVSNPFTHKFYIRYRNDIDFNKWVEYKSEKYDIVDVEDFEQENEWLLLMCTRKGLNTKAANYA